MKKLLSVLLFCIILTIGITAFADRPVKLFVGGERVISDVLPTVVEGRTMLPLRAAFEAIGATVAWDDATQTVTATKGETEVKLTIGSKVMLVDGVEKPLDVAAYLENGRTMVPVRACAEAFGLQVDWLPGANTVKVRMEVDVEIEVELDTEDGVKFNKWHTFDARGNYIEYKDNIGDHSNRKYTYDSNDNLIEYRDKYDDWFKYTYDGYGNVICMTSSYGDKYVYDYDDLNRVIYISENDEEIQKITYNDEDGYYVISYSNKKRGDDYKSETHHYKPGDDIYSWHISYPSDYYIFADNKNLDYYLKCMKDYTLSEDDFGNIILTQSYYKYTFDPNGLIISCEYSANGKDKSVDSYVRDANGKLLYIDTCYYVFPNITSHTIQKYTRITR